MSDEQDKAPSKLEQLRARMRAVWARIDGTAAEESVEAPKVVCIRSRKAFEAPEADEAAEGERPVNHAIVEELEGLLERAQAGEIVSLTYVAEDVLAGGFDNQAIFAIHGDQNEAQQALKHIGALELVKDILLNVAYSNGEPLEMEFASDEDEE